MPDIYISRAGVELAELEERFTQTRVEEVQTEIVKARQEHALQVDRLERELEALRSEFKALAPVLKKKPAIPLVESELSRRNRS